MANEITKTFAMSVANGNFSETLQRTITIDQAGIGGGNPGVIDVGTTDEPISTGDLATTQGVAWFQNLDETNYVEIGPESAGVLQPFMRLPAGDIASVTLSPGVQLRAKANAAPVRLLVKVYDA